MSASPECVVIAGDPSGDIHAAPIIRALKSRYNDIVLSGIGGPAMQQEGFTPLMPFEPFNKMGFLEVVLHLPFFLSAQKKLKAYLKTMRPKCLVCVDYSGFNIPMMKAARKLGIPVVWYIVPMVWAWKKKRAEVLGRHASHICCIFPFEASYFEPFSGNVHFVGNPVAEALPHHDPLRTGKQIASGSFSLALVPGSREQEVVRVLPEMVAAYKLLKSRFPECKGVVSRHRSFSEARFLRQIAGTDIEVSSDPLTDVLARSDLAVVTSGTATLEAALSGIPHVIVYKTSALSYSLFRHFIVLSHIGLPNIIANETVAPELIQQYVTGMAIAKELVRFIADSQVYDATVHKLCAVRNLLGSRKPSESVAEIISSVLRS